jgi:hypothetical protein
MEWKDERREHVKPVNFTGPAQAGPQSAPDALEVAARKLGAA